MGFCFHLPLDIDECDPAKQLDRCSQICENTLGSYNCSCLKGFKLRKDGYDCEGINEFDNRWNYFAIIVVCFVVCLSFLQMELILHKKAA